MAGSVGVLVDSQGNSVDNGSSSGSNWLSFFNGLTALGTNIATAVEAPGINPAGISPVATPGYQYPVYQGGQVVGFSSQPQNTLGGGLAGSINASTLLWIFGIGFVIWLISGKR